MRSMLVLAAVAALSFTSVSRADDAKKTEMTGVLIDNHCAEDMAKQDDPQKAAADHKKGCCVKCAKDGGLSLMSEGKLTKLDKASTEKAIEYLNEKKHGTAVIVEASKNDDGTLAVASIEPAKKKKGEKAEETK